MSGYFESFLEGTSTHDNAKISDLISGIRNSQSSLPELSSSLDSKTAIRSRSLPGISPGKLINQSSMMSAFTVSHHALEEIYRLNSIISMTLEGTSSLLMSEAAAIEDDLMAMEKAIMNYDYSVGVQGNYNYNYIETFSDDTGRDPMMEAPDRASIGFGISQMASLIPQEGALVLPKNEVVSHATDVKLVDGNCMEHIRGGLNRTDDIPVAKQWRGIVDSIAPITSKLPGAEDYSGAQVVLEYRLSSPAPASEVKIDPYSDTPAQVLSVMAFPTDLDSDGVELLSHPMILDRSKTIHFPMRSVSRIRVTLNQPTYNRVSTTSSVEDEYRIVHEALLRKLRAIRGNTSYNTESGMANLLFLTYEFYNKGKPVGSAIPVSPNANYRGVSTVPKWLEKLKTIPRTHMDVSGHSSTIFSDPGRDPSDSILDYIKMMLLQREASYEMFFNREIAKFGQYLNEKGIYDPEGFFSPVQMIYRSGWVYRYSLGIQNITIGIESNGYRGFHITRPLDTNGDIGEVSIKVEELNGESPDITYDNPLLTSTEYSTSNKSNPNKEEDWRPILPVGTKVIESERLYPNEAGVCMLRFLMDVASPIFVYKNNYSMEVTGSNFIYDSLSQSIMGIRIPIDLYTPEDILTVTYTPPSGLNYTVVNFFNEGFDDTPALTNAYDASGSGEFFSSTLGVREVVLDHSPYIDSKKSRESEYSMTHGMLTYQPVVVRFDDGNIAINLTNYSGGSQARLPADGNYFVHSGRSISFNKQIDKPFRVHYQFMQNNVRIRTVLRCNNREFVSPKVNSLHIRAKTRRASIRGLNS